MQIQPTQIIRLEIVNHQTKTKQAIRQAIADNLNHRFDTHFDFHNIIMTVGAAGGLNIIFKTILDPGDEVLVFAPYFGEYNNYAANFDAKTVAVNPDIATFQPDLADFEKKFTEKTNTRRKAGETSRFS